MSRREFRIAAIFVAALLAVLLYWLIVPDTMDDTNAPFAGAYTPPPMPETLQQYVNRRNAGMHEVFDVSLNGDPIRLAVTTASGEGNTLFGVDPATDEIVQFGVVGERSEARERAVCVAIDDDAEALTVFSGNADGEVHAYHTTLEPIDAAAELSLHNARLRVGEMVDWAIPGEIGDCVADTPNGHLYVAAPGVGIFRIAYGADESQPVRVIDGETIGYTSFMQAQQDADGSRYLVTAGADHERLVYTLPDLRRLPDDSRQME